MAKTSIEWADWSVNPIRTADGGYHCTKVSEACEHCYAEAINFRFGNKKPFGATPVEFVLDEKPFEKLLRSRKPKRVFLQSMGDITHEDVPYWMLDRIFAWMAKLHRHTFMVLTKRPARLRDYILRAMYDEDCNYDGWYEQIDALGVPDVSPMQNVWVGVTAENQARADERIPILLQIPAAVHFVSYEPALGPISFRWAKWDNWRDGEGRQRSTVNEYDGLRALDLIIAGGETGPGARPAHPDWFRKVRDECKEAGVAFFFKSHGFYIPAVGTDEVGDVYFPPAEHDTSIDPFGDGTYMLRVNREIQHLARLLDGVEHNELPEVTPHA